MRAPAKGSCLEGDIFDGTSFGGCRAEDDLPQDSEVTESFHLDLGFRATVSKPDTEVGKRRSKSAKGAKRVPLHFHHQGKRSHIL